MMMLNILPLPLSLRATLSPTDELDQWAGGPDQGKEDGTVLTP